MYNIKTFLIIAVLVLMISPIAVSADISFLAPILSFEMSGAQYITINGDSEDMGLLAYHESSQNWVLFFRANDNDIVPYDNLELIISCENSDTVSINTTEYDTWNDEGILSIVNSYGDDSYEISYNSIDFVSKYSYCTVEVNDYGAGSYVNNTLNYTTFETEMLPYLSAIEFVSCDDVESGELTFLGESQYLVSIMTDGWEILWLVYSIFIVVFGVFMIPIFIFIFLRWAIFRITGFKLVEKKNRGTVTL